MKDFPLFPCRDGMASLVLSEIPYRKEAYIFIRSVHGSLSRLLQDCGDFCKAAGARHIYVTGEAALGHLPVYARLVERRLHKSRLPSSSARAELTDSPAWAELYNQRFFQVPSAKTYEKTPKDAYFVYEGERRIGLGQIINDELAAVASLVPGCGEKALCALAEKIVGEEVRLLSAEENLPATRLYDRLGFSRDKILRIWYCL